MADGQLATTNEAQDVTSSSHTDDVTALGAQVSEVLKVDEGAPETEKSPPPTDATVEVNGEKTVEEREKQSSDASADKTAEKAAEAEQTEAPPATVQPNTASGAVTIQNSPEGQSSSVQEGTLSMDQSNEATTTTAAAAAADAKETKEDATAAEADKTKPKEAANGAEEPKKAKSSKSKEKKSGFCKTS